MCIAHAATGMISFVVGAENIFSAKSYAEEVAHDFRDLFFHLYESTEKGSGDEVIGRAVGDPDAPVVTCDDIKNERNVHSQYELISNYDYKMIGNTFYSTTEWFIPEMIHAYTVMEIQPFQSNEFVVKLHPRFMTETEHADLQRSISLQTIARTA